MGYKAIRAAQAARAAAAAQKAVQGAGKPKGYYVSQNDAGNDTTGSQEATQAQEQSVTPAPTPPDDPNCKDGKCLGEKLMPNGQPIGQAGSSSGIREVQGDMEEAQALFDELKKGGMPTNNPSYPGTQVKMPNGDIIGLRGGGTKSPGTSATIDINAQGVPIQKIKFNP